MPTGVRQLGSGEDTGAWGQDSPGPAKTLAPGARTARVRRRHWRLGPGQPGSGEDVGDRGQDGAEPVRAGPVRAEPRAGGLDYAGRRSRLTAMRDGLTAGIRSRTRASPHTVPVPTAAPATVSVK